MPLQIYRQLIDLCSRELKSVLLTVAGRGYSSCVPGILGAASYAMMFRLGSLLAPQPSAVWFDEPTTDSELDRFLAPTAPALMGFATRHNLQLKKSGNKPFASWSLGFRHPKGGLGGLGIPVIEFSETINKVDSASIPLTYVICTWNAFEFAVCDKDETAGVLAEWGRSIHSEDMLCDPHLLEERLKDGFGRLLSWRYGSWPGTILWREKCSLSEAVSRVQKLLEPYPNPVRCGLMHTMKQMIGANNRTGLRLKYVNSLEEHWNSLDAANDPW